MTKLDETKQILQKRLHKLKKHYDALKNYRLEIDSIMKEKNIYNQFDFNTLNVTQRAVLDAYLKRFASLQDFLGAKVFSLLLEIAGIHHSKMSEV